MKHQSCRLLLVLGLPRIALRTRVVSQGETRQHTPYLHDNLEVRHHHSNPSEQRFQVFGQLLSAGVTRIHRDEEAAHGLQENILRVSRELEVLFACFLGILDGQHLYGWKNRGAALWFDFGIRTAVRHKQCLSPSQLSRERIQELQLV